jgi:hypothetical protein
MKANVKSNVAGIIIIIGALIIMIGYIRSIVLNARPVKAPVMGWTYNMIEPIDELDLPDTLPYKKYQALKDSITTIRHLKNGSGALDKDKGQFAYLGTQVSLVCDTCSFEWSKDRFMGALLSSLANSENDTGDYKDHVQYYIKLHAFTIRKNFSFIDDDGNFYAKNGQGYLRTTRVDTSKAGIASNKINIVDIPVKFRYNEKDQSLLIPVTAHDAKTFRIFTDILLWLYILDIVLLLYVFLRFIYDTSKGRSFTRKNVARLRLIAVTVCVFPAAVILLNVCMRLIYHDYFTEEIVLKSVVWTDSWNILRFGILLAMLYVAFSRATALQEEQDLTV